MIRLCLFEWQDGEEDGDRANRESEMKRYTPVPAISPSASLAEDTLANNTPLKFGSLQVQMINCR